MLELSLVSAFVLVTKQYTPSTMSANIATPPAIKPTIRGVFHLEFCAFPVFEVADGGVFSGGTCWAAGSGVMTGSKDVSDVDAFLVVAVDEVTVVIPRLGSVALVFQTMVVDVGMVVLPLVSSGEVVV